MVDVHGCGHIMRILRGLNEKGKCIFYGHQMCIKNGRKGLEIGRKWYGLDKMSKQEMGRIWYKELLIRMIIGLQ